jgi:uncharacterized membrane protein
MISKAEVCVVLAAMIVYCHASLSVIQTPPNLRIFVAVFFSAGRVADNAEIGGHDLRSTGHFCRL